MGISPDQLNRVEREEIGVRFLAAWSFCRFTDRNPLWLAFGDSEEKTGFSECVNSNIPDLKFLFVMQCYADRYRLFRSLPESEAIWEVASVFVGAEGLLDKVRASERVSTDPKKLFGDLKIKSNLILMNPIAPVTWEQLRTILRTKTDSPEAKLDLAKHLGVSLAAVSQWRSNAARPTADKTLQILAWLREPAPNPQQKKRAGRAATRPAPKTQKGKIKSNEKSKSDPKKR